MSDENGNGEDNGDNENGKVQFRKKDGVEKDGYICFPVEVPPEEVEEVEQEDDKPPPPPVKIDMTTCPEDPRFQQMNKTKWCFRMYTDYHRCRYLLGDSASQCDYFYRCYNSICPNAWLEKWDDQIKNGNFPYDFTRKMPQAKQDPCT